MSTTGRGRGIDDEESPAAPPIPSFASLRAPRRTHAALDVLLPPAAREPAAAVEVPAVRTPVVEPVPVVDRRVRPAVAPPATPRPAEWPDLLHFGVRVATTALRRLRRLLGE
ncbi:hypothetical protein [Blastococcus aggregatus]|uniref:hypothetical protein n=1 Tax=Blastococcus aggregatus TaxID=38502 RepID=UPI0011420E4C|nr:hypothetical protein [Blastococcus aggregatus]